MTIQKIESQSREAQSADITAENIAQLKALFPELLTESANGVAINVDVLKQLVGDATATDAEEKYGLNWHGKRRARQLALTPSNGTLRPCVDDSLDWDTTQNLMIEGDNLEVLKLMQKSYAGKVKLIYIDPPYNTGKDFVYPDNFQDNIKNYLELTGQVEGDRKISSNSEASGRFHTDWLNMMYPRLKLARNLLRQEGTIFINCGETELGNLSKLCDDVYGEENRITIISRMMKSGGAKGSFFTPNIDYILVYARDKVTTPHFRIPLSTEQIDTYYNKVETQGQRKGEIFGEERLYKASLDPRANQRYWIECPDQSFVIPPGVHFPEQIAQGEKILPTAEDGVWKWTFARYEEELQAGNIVFKETSTSALVNADCKSSKWNIYNKVWLKDQQEKGVVPSNFLDDFENRQSSAELKGLQVPFDFAKPIGLMRHILQIAKTGENDLILDFFAGSGTMGHAVMAQNAVDGGNRAFVLVQLPESLDVDSIDQKTAAIFCDGIGKPRTIAELTKERLRRAGAKVKAENPLFAGDTGFRVFKLDNSNIRAWNPDRNDLEKTLLDHEEHILPGRTEADIVYELLLKLGLDLCVPIESRSIAGMTVGAIGGGVLLACLSERIAAAEVEALAQGIVAWRKELAPAGDTTCVFRDSAFENDIAKSNLAAILEQHGIGNVRSL